MDTSNQIGDSSSTEAVDWRTKLPSENRQKIINKIIMTFGKHLPPALQESVNELRAIAMRFEQKCYTTATSQSDYMRKISVKLMTKEKNTSANPVPNHLPSNDAVSSSDPGDIKVSKKRNYMEHVGSGANVSASDKAPGQVSAARTLEILKRMLKQHTDALKMFKEEEMKFEASCKQLAEIISNLES